MERGGVVVDERIGFGFYQSCRNKGSVGRVSVLGCGGVGGEWVCDLDQGLEGWCDIMCQL